MQQKAGLVPTSLDSNIIESLPGPSIFRTPRIHAVAVNATEMAESHAEIKEFLAAKIAALSEEHKDLEDALQVACDSGWATAPLSRQTSKLARSVLYYEKLLAALDAGFTIVPNMPCDQFAIRVKRTAPSVKSETRRSEYGKKVPFLADETEDPHLPAGEGRYESPTQRVSTNVFETKNEKGATITTTTVSPTAWGEIDFPLAAAVPMVMSATQAAMSLRLFDRIGIVPQSVRRDADPIILGQIVRKDGYQVKVTSFLIAWHLDFRTL
jgi:hypothetical protein